jgi:hypothetical protein
MISFIGGRQVSNRGQGTLKFDYFGMNVWPRPGEIPHLAVGTEVSKETQQYSHYDTRIDERGWIGSNEQDYSSMWNETVARIYLIIFLPTFESDVLCLHRCWGTHFHFLIMASLYHKRKYECSSLSYPR